MATLTNSPPPRLIRLTKKTTGYEHKDWVFTHFGFDNKWEPDYVQTHMNKIFQAIDCLTAKYSIEKCPTTDRLHIQGQMQLRFRLTIKKIQSASSPQFGFLQDKKSAGTAYVEKNFSHISGPYSYLHSHKRDFKRTVEYWYGIPGNGKTFGARKLLRTKYLEDPYEVCKADASKGTWFSDYNGQKSAIFDEVDVKWMSESSWKKVLDTAPATLPSASGGRTIQWEPEHIIMISNYPPPPLFESSAFKDRRITRIVHITAPRRPELQKTKILETSCVPDS